MQQVIKISLSSVSILVINMILVSFAMSTDSSVCRRLALRFSKAHGVLGSLQFLDNIIRHVPVSMFYVKILKCLMVFLNLYQFLIVLSDRVRSRRFGPKS